MIDRRHLIALAGSAAAADALPGSALAQQDKVIRIGFQKYGKIILLKSKGTLEKALEPLGYRATWTEFPAGPQLLEGINVGAIDVGNTGEAPPIFAQAAGAPLAYVAHEPPAPKGEAILVPRNSTISSVAELKGKKVALNKGSNVHYLLVKALEKAGVPYADVTLVFLAPADARAAFERGAVDAWAIWDPFQAAAEKTLGARTLTDGTGLVANHQFYLAHERFVANHEAALKVFLRQLAEVDAWAQNDIKAVGEALSASTGIPAPIIELALGRQSYGIRPLDAATVAEQQRIADTFHALGLIPKPITVAPAVRRIEA